MTSVKCVFKLGRVFESLLVNSCVRLTANTVLYLEREKRTILHHHSLGVHANVEQVSVTKFFRKKWSTFDSLARTFEIV